MPAENSWIGVQKITTFLRGGRRSMHRKVTKLIFEYRRGDIQAKVRIKGKLADILGVSFGVAQMMLNQLPALATLWGCINKVSKGNDKTIFTFGPKDKPGEGRTIDVKH